MDYQHTQKSQILLVGLTGGIASGKSTVAHMFEEMGSRVIDFDMLARLVVEPGRPAWKKTVGYFGNDILQDNGEIDRKRLSRIIFGDSEKRKMLEGFTHPLITEECMRQVDEIAYSNQDAIILAVVPLLFEAGMQALFHKVVVVYIPREGQIKRLIERDGINKEHAINILNAQMHIDEKIRRADFVINNENSIEETNRQVRDMWDTLRDLQKDIALKRQTR
ncbi:MAG TPA: dephospho-CoA kinase [Desulfatiglandales bacterium]|nr:dephospho-CoA kinase [Desulfatiglandales bacterium]